MDAPLTIGTREDGLARAQADWIVHELREHAPDFPIHLQLVRPSENRVRGVHVDHIAENRVGIDILHRMLREGDCDVVVHRGFDLRDSLPADLAIAAIPHRSSPFEAVVCPSGLAFDELESGTPVGVVSSSARACSCCSTVTTWTTFSFPETLLLGWRNSSTTGSPPS
jgi:hydroxymethylbilane synthase